MKANVPIVMDWVRKHEGGYAERSTEGGGAVNMGVTFTVFKAWRLLGGQPEPTFADLKAMTRDEASAIYEAQYLAAVHFDDLPSGLDYAVYDASVLGGPTGALKLLQEALGLTVDGVWGMVTRWAANHRPLPALIDKYCDTRLAKYRTFKTWNKVAVAKSGKTWGQIWTDRIEQVRKRAHDLANEGYAHDG